MWVGEVFKGSPGDIPAARRLAGELVGRMGEGGARVPATFASDVQLVVSELVTNAVKHAGGQCGLELRAAEDAMEITVWDTSGHGVTVMEPDPLRVGRHGLEIVRKLCDELTVTTTPSGKRITARMAVRPSAV
ncbi:Anti-sigma regulatory factor (Ser/Thr protein kinase) [Actinacidiphila yanglinensis]|uniref:Anti-sigma regulatory factor (Ser/Thr protein kinase) n=1 Tax=Actinacidiphila yanglinensis TaxID=310779 RepID=A0A1H6ED73_9ACTN|nr:ATP-binding protein [Actinacidiphila yanglinensis]SEG95758.1 Anti-sigma regulatory factor (Ser/Thr protein kinase) [Actinacidiphila yanglinensis]